MLFPSSFIACFAWFWAAFRQFFVYFVALVAEKAVLAPESLFRPVNGVHAEQCMRSTRSLVKICNNRYNLLISLIFFSNKLTVKPWPLLYIITAVHVFSCLFQLCGKPKIGTTVGWPVLMLPNFIYYSCLTAMKHLIWFDPKKKNNFFLNTRNIFWLTFF